MRCVGTVVRGIRTPIIKENDNLAQIVVDSLLSASENEKFEFRDRDIVAITEAVVGISEGNYATLDNIATDIKEKFPEGEIGLIFPILSRNRFAVLLEGIARGCKKITLMLSYPSDEVGNSLFDKALLEKYHIDPYRDVLDEVKYNEYFKNEVHIFTGVNYVDVYRDLIEKEGCEVQFIFANDPKVILNYEKNVLNCDIHTRENTKKILQERGANVYSLSDILNKSIDGSGFNPNYGLLGSNRSTEERVKLFPKSGEQLVNSIQNILKEKTGKTIEVMVYGDGAFKDPVGGIWELADPVVSPAYTKGLEGHPNELKLKYFADNKFKDLTGEALNEAIRNEIKNKDNNLKGQMASQGTTPRRLTDLIGSLCDLTSGSGDKGTPVVFIQGYFDNYSN